VKRRFQESSPRIHPSAFVHESTEVIGRVIIRHKASIWPLVVLRGDIEPIIIGPETNIQDSAILHTSHGIPVVLGKGVTVGHGAIIHGARVGDYSLIGMGAILLDGCVVGPECLIGAGALISEGMKIPARSLVLGIPGRIKRSLRREELALLHKRPKDYVQYARAHVRFSRPVEREA
jgi:carbonic anhydrase/acetyltransferase-like protein (isoleucine patch superfamily)